MKITSKLSSVQILAQRTGLRTDVAVVLFLSIGIVGCQSMQMRTDEEKLFSLADRVESNAFRYGSISVGAVRLSAYDDSSLIKARKKLLEHVKKLQETALTSDQKPESVQIRKTERGRTIEMNVPLAGDAWKAVLTDISRPLIKNQTGSASPPNDQPSNQSQAGASAGDNGSDIDQIEKWDGVVDPQPIASARRSLALSQYLKSRLEDISLDSMFPVDPEHYRRVELSLALTAWTRSEARSALAYLDIYPFNGDIWCHRLVVKLAATKNLDEAKATVLEHVDFLKKGGTYRKSLMLPDGQYFPVGWTDKEFEKSDEDNRTGLCHAFLSNQHLTPKLVHVDSLDEGEFTSVAQRDTKNAVQRESFGGIFGQTKNTQDDVFDVTKGIRFTSMTFAAGEHRAGYFFQPGAESKSMRPVEQRLRLVLDLPKDMERFEIHVHKTFFGRDDLPLSTFGKQTIDAIEARELVEDIEKQYPGESNSKPLFRTPAIWQMAKTRARNLYQQGWSERIVVFVPASIDSQEENKAKK